MLIIPVEFIFLSSSAGLETAPVYLGVYFRFCYFTSIVDEKSTIVLVKSDA